MTRTEALRRVADLHAAWSLKHGDDVPHNPEHAASDLSLWQADRSAPPKTDDPLNEAIKAILSQIDETPAVEARARDDARPSRGFREWWA